MMPLDIVLVFNPARIHRLPEQVSDLPAEEAATPIVVLTAWMPEVVLKSHCSAVGLAPNGEFKLRARGTVAPTVAVAEETCRDTVWPVAMLAIMHRNVPRLIVVFTVTIIGH
jgi:hypothetical protein